MRTTITLDDDVAVRLAEKQRTERRTFKDVVNETLRAGLDPAPREPAAEVQYTHPMSLGVKVDVSCIGAVLTQLDEDEIKDRYGRTGS